MLEYLAPAVLRKCVSVSCGVSITSMQRDCPIGLAYTGMMPKSLTIGPNKTLVPARSTSSALALDGDEVQEEEARAIAGLALHLSGTHEPNSMVSLGPGAHGALSDTSGS